MYRPFALNLLKLSMYLLEVENEDNAVICLRIIIDLHKSYRSALENEVQPFLEIVQKFYTELPKTLSTTFTPDNKAKPPQPQQQLASLDGGGLEPHKSTVLIKYVWPLSLFPKRSLYSLYHFNLYSSL